LEAITANATQIADVSDAAILQIVQAYAFVNSLVVKAGHSLMQEGSEHYFAYAMEARTGRSFVHGEILGLGAMLMSQVQKNAPERVLEVLRACHVAWSPNDQGLASQAVVETLCGLKEFVDQAGLPYSIANVSTISRDEAESLVANLDAFDRPSRDA
jgi:glycerol dehydrogenase-like iron-containing ADH family enzyme